MDVDSTSKQPLAGVMVEINGRRVVDLKERTLPPGGSLKYLGGPESVICGPTWKELARVPMEAALRASARGPRR